MSYVAGRRAPGKPDAGPRPAEFTEFHDAVTHLVQWVERLWDADYEASYSKPGEVGIREAADARWLPIHTALHNASSPFTFEAGGFTWYITPKESK